MSQTRGTRFNTVGRTIVMSSNRVDRSLLPVKYAMPPSDSVLISQASPYMWDSGMYCRWMAGIWVPVSFDGLCGRCQNRWIRLLVYIAPLGVPVLPEV